MDESEKRATARVHFRRQDGLITLEQARVAGFSASAVARRVASGEWEVAAPRVYRDAGARETARSRVRAATLSVPAAILVGRGASWWWRMDDEEPEVIDLAVTTSGLPRPRPGTRFTRRAPGADDIVVVDGVRVTKRAVTLLDTAAGLDLLAGARLLDRALLRGRVGLDELRETLARTCPRQGSPRLRELVDLAAGGARSQAERVAIRNVKAQKITGWTANLEVRLPDHGSAILDLAFRELRIVVEIDGWAYHRDLRAFVHDARRQNALAADGWIVIRTNWYELHHDPGAFIAALRAVIAQRSRELSRSAR